MFFQDCIFAIPAQRNILNNKYKQARSRSLTVWHNDYLALTFVIKY